MGGNPDKRCCQLDNVHASGSAIWRALLRLRDESRQHCDEPKFFRTGERASINLKGATVSAVSLRREVKAELKCSGFDIERRIH